MLSLKSVVCRTEQLPTVSPEVYQMKRLLPTLCLMAILAISLTSCAKDIPIYREHTHAYVATHTRGTCLQFGHTEYRCHCGDRYTVSDTEYGSHSYAPAVVNSDSRRAVILESSGEYLTTDGTWCGYSGIKGSYCTECGAYFSFERIKAEEPDLPPL